MQRYAQPQPAAAQYRPAGMQPGMQPGMPAGMAMAPQPSYPQAPGVTRMPSASAGQMVQQLGTMKSMPTTGSAFPAQTMTQFPSAAQPIGTMTSGQIATQSATQVGQGMAPATRMQSGQTQSGTMFQQAAMPQQQPQLQQSPVMTREASPQAAAAPIRAGTSQREQELEKKVRELERLVDQQQREIKDLQSALQRQGGRGTQSADTFRDNGRYGGLKKSTSSPGASKRSGRPINPRSPLAEGKPQQAYQALDIEDPVDTRLEEFYNSTNSLIPFRRINRGFYRFGGTICELKIVNQKLMACTEDGWNRGHMAPIDKFMTHYEPIERERAGLPLD
mmetsp:Transcript_49059/g.116728  ORF Transcript_49059/g.116728 Transcript_49059/m.116728 type:complete len:334 (-) Transcript_49059:94-1095(-)|eukprot:CAMPEP_0178460064 /NCGR_PEP_ID=MMETSP0689_2-20121128/48479_1 /TAXON_ID=160604 /ORGANISM="Amphidinium massartii, Strain CS-259" /LENGTH=333 /DNA_ID=CAMNT_0020086613 /DNA_START=86 /DNA_END=1087 /DNA_ORIENTATION=-